MKSILFFISVFLVILFIYISIRIAEKILGLLKGIIKTLAIIIFFFSVLAISTTPEAFGEFLQPAMQHLSPIVDWVFDTIFNIFKYIRNLPDEAHEVTCLSRQLFKKQ